MAVPLKCRRVQMYGGVGITRWVLDINVSIRKFIKLEANEDRFEELADPQERCHLEVNEILMVKNEANFKDVLTSGVPRPKIPRMGKTKNVYLR